MSLKKAKDKIEYNRKAALVKRKSRKLQRESWNTFVLHLEEETYKLRSKTYKILKRINADFNEKLYLPKLKMEDFVEYYNNLWTETSDGAMEITERKTNGNHEKIINIKKDQKLQNSRRRWPPSRIVQVQ